MSLSRQLAAIMPVRPKCNEGGFTDIAGYTALMGKDEQVAFELLETNRNLQNPIIAAENGPWIREMGDGVMACFNTGSDAVSAAVIFSQSGKIRLVDV